MKCGDCEKFVDCFNSSNVLIGVEPHCISGKMLEEAMLIPACWKFNQKTSITYAEKS